MKYSEALAAAHKAGASRASGEALLAQTASLSGSLGAYVPEWIYEGARARGMTSLELGRMLHDTSALLDLQWEGADIVSPVER